MPCTGMSRPREFKSGVPFGCLILSGVMMIGGCASSRTDVAAETIQPVPASENAALTYWEAWWELGPEVLPEFKLFDFERADQSEENADPPEISERGLDLLKRAASMPRCDFGVDLEIFASGDPDESLALSHYWLLLKSYGLLLEEAKKCLDTGNTKQAAELYLASLFMIDHGTQQPDLVTFVLTVAFAETIDEIKEKQGEFQKSDREIFAQAVSRFNREDPFRTVWGFRLFMIAYANSIRNGTVENEEGFNPDDLDRIAQLIHEFMDADPAQDDRLWKQLGMNKQNPTRKGSEPLILELREQESKAIEALNWLREWSSN